MNTHMSTAAKIADNTPVVLHSSDGEIRITSVELVDMINNFRKEEGNDTEKRHSDLMTSIKYEIDALNKACVNQRNFSLVKYVDKKGEERPCYTLNKAGTLQMLNKESAVVRYKTTQYIETLEEALKQQQTPMSMEDIIIYQMQQSKMMKEQLEQTQAVALEAKEQADRIDQKIQDMRDAIILDHSAWREDTKKIVVNIAHKFGGSAYIQDVWKEAYGLLESRAKTRLEIKLNNRRKTILAETGSKTKASKYTKLDVIDEDARIRETFIAIIKEMAIKYGVC